MEAVGKEKPLLGDTWTGRPDFILTCIAYVVGLSNIWSFPFLVSNNGGAAFLIIYIVLLLTIGIPYCFMEMSLGQFSGRGAAAFTKAVPFFQGTGWAMIFISALGAVLYNLSTAYCFRYLVAAFTLAWDSCAGDSGNCTSSAEDYRNEVLNRGTSASKDLSNFKWDLIVCSIVSCFLVLLVLVRGIKILGKVTYVVVFVPYLLLIALLARIYTLDGATDGITRYLNPDWDKMADPKVWFEAGSQVVWSLGIGWGGIMTLSSYNNFHNNVFRDSFIVSIVDSLTSFLCGFMVYGFLGHMASVTGDDAYSKDPDSYFGFVTFAEGVLLLPTSVAWAVLFYLICSFFIFGVQLVTVETVITGVLDLIDKRGNGRARIVITVFTIIAIFVSGLVLTSPAGELIADMVDHYGLTIPTFALLLAMGISLSWFYGVKRFSEDIRVILPMKTLFNICRKGIWWVLWAFISPLGALLLLAYFAYTWEVPSYDHPAALGYVFMGIPLVMIVLGMIAAVITWGILPSQPLFGPTEDYGRSDDQIMEELIQKKLMEDKKEQKRLDKINGTVGLAMPRKSILAPMSRPQSNGHSIDDNAPTYIFNVLKNGQRYSYSNNRPSLQMAPSTEYTPYGREYSTISPGYPSAAMTTMAPEPYCQTVSQGSATLVHCSM